jgi:Undecaprenyl-phosphate glucose phosphotransferase
MMVADVTLVAAAWIAAYGLRFHAGYDAPLGIPDFERYAVVLLVIVPLWLVLLRRYGLYEAKRLESMWREAGDVLRVTATGVLLLVGLSFFERSYSYSRAVVAIFSLLAPALVIGLRVCVRLGLRQARRRGYNLRFVLVVGAGRLAEEVIGRIHGQPQAGLRLVGVVADGAAGRFIGGVPVVASYAGLKQALARTRIDQVIIALPREEAGRLEKILDDLDDEMTSVKLVPDLMHFMTLHASAESLEGLPVIGLRESPMVGWAAVQKRAFDLVVSTLLLVLLAPLYALIALAVLGTSGRPVFYRQQRMGLDGHLFEMVKFRSMTVGAESEQGAVWTRQDDPRRTRLGAWLRRFGLDELPQLWNVLRGDMSLVGPRPERPVFIEEFRREIPGYMLRHKVRAGLTGWAQVHGWRGDTSLHERIEHDIYYIRNWSLGLDLEILARTLWRSIFERNAY